MKRRVAIWIHGGIGNGEFSQGYPMLDKIFSRLNKELDIVVYSHVAPNAGFHSTNFPLVYPPRSIKSGKLRWIILFFYFLRDHIRKKYNVTFAFWGYPIGFFVAMFKIFLRVPCVTYLLGADAAGISSINFGVFHKRFPRMISKWAYGKATALITTAEYLKAKLKDFGVNREIKIIKWGVDPTLFAFSKKQQGEILEVIHVANIHPVKDQTTLLKAFALIVKEKQARLKIFGLDSMNGAMKKLCVDLGIEKHVEFMGVVQYDQLPKHYAAANLMLHTSMSEAQCMALTEAVATGVLIAGTRVGLLYEIGDACGVVVEVGDYEGLAKKVLDLLKMPDEWNTRVDKARVWAENHSLDRTIKELTNLLETISKN